ncbi:MAG: septum formation initiator family protein [Holosporaceae bacterium]
MFGRLRGRFYTRRAALLRFGVVVVWFLALLYIAYYLLKGDLGLEALARLTQRATLLQQQSERLEARHQDLTRKTRLLKTPIDQDMLEEQVKLVLGYVGPDERAVIDTAR